VQAAVEKIIAESEHLTRDFGHRHHERNGGCDRSRRGGVTKQ